MNDHEWNRLRRLERFDRFSTRLCLVILIVGIPTTVGYALARSWPAAAALTVMMIVAWIMYRWHPPLITFIDEPYGEQGMR